MVAAVGEQDCMHPATLILILYGEFELAATTAVHAVANDPVPLPENLSRNPCKNLEIQKMKSC